MRTMIGECLRQAGIVTETDLQSALIEHKRSGERLGFVLIRLGLATERQIAKALAGQLGFPYVEPAASPLDPGCVVLFPKGLALRRNLVGVAGAGERGGQVGGPGGGGGRAPPPPPDGYRFPVVPENR